MGKLYIKFIGFLFFRCHLIGGPMLFPLLLLSKLDSLGMMWCYLLLVGGMILLWLILLETKVIKKSEFTLKEMYDIYV